MIWILLQQKTMNSKLVGHIAIFLAYVIFGFNIITCKNLATYGIVSPLGIFCFRAIGATICFWLVSLFLPKEKIDKQDFPKIFLASMFGLFLTQISFLFAIKITTPMDASILAALTPVFTMFMAALFLKEPITLKKAGGVALSFIGVTLLIMNSVQSSNGVTQTQPLGVFLMICNGLFFGIYLGAFRPLVEKYSTITFMKWMFLFSMLVSVPFDIQELCTIDYTSIPWGFIANLSFTVFCATFLSYFLVPIGQKRLRPTVVSMYTYIQPFIAAIMGIILQMDIVTWKKVVAAILVFSGVYLVNKSKAKEENA